MVKPIFLCGMHRHSTFLYFAFDICLARSWSLCFKMCLVLDWQNLWSTEEYVDEKVKTLSTHKKKVHWKFRPVLISGDSINLFLIIMLYYSTPLKYLNWYLTLKPHIKVCVLKLFSYGLYCSLYPVSWGSSMAQTTLFFELLSVCEESLTLWLDYFPFGNVSF